MKYRYQYQEDRHPIIKVLQDRSYVLAQTQTLCVPIVLWVDDMNVKSYRLPLVES